MSNCRTVPANWGTSESRRHGNRAIVSVGRWHFLVPSYTASAPPVTESRSGAGRQSQMIRTRLTDLVGCTAPIQQAPMGTVSSPRLAVAVAEAGGIGSINTLGVTRETLRQHLDDMREQTDGVLAVSFLTNDIDADAVADAASRVRVVDFFWSDPRPDLVDIAHRGGALVNWQVGSVEEARAAVQAGADMVCAQGVEAGGHCRGDSPLLPLLCEVLDAVDVPVLAAGGIADARGVAAALAAGASGVRMGTRFIATEESAAHSDYVAAILAAGANSTRITDAFNDCPLCESSPRARVLISSDRCCGGDRRRRGRDEARAPTGRCPCRAAPGYRRPKTSADTSRRCACMQANPSPSSTPSCPPHSSCVPSPKTPRLSLKRVQQS